MDSVIFVYVLRSLSTGRHYVGITKNLDRRVREHNADASRSTAQLGPWKLLYYEKCPDYVFARKRERYLKSGPGHAFLRKAGVA